MKKIKMIATKKITFREGCDKYLEDCRQRNLREGTIRHYRQSFDYFFKYFNPNMPIDDIDISKYTSLSFIEVNLLIFVKKNGTI